MADGSGAGGIPGDDERHRALTAMLGHVGADVEVRAFCPGVGVREDPVTGSLNAGIAMWLRASGQAPASYVAAQGAALGRAGRIHVHDDGEHIWIGGDTTTVIEGTVTL